LKNQKKHSAGQILRFCLAGSLAVAVQYAFLYVGIHFLQVTYTIAAFVASVLNLLASFLLQRSWTFKNKDTKDLPKQAVPYLIMRIVMIILNSPFLYILVDFCHLPVFAGQAILTVLFSIASYIFSAKIFAPKTVPPI
jgi:putative flippase GtrA